MSGFELELASPEGALFSGQVQQLNVRTFVGEMTVLPRHAELCAVLAPGTLRFTTVDGAARSTRIEGGVLCIRQGKALLAVRTAGTEESERMK